MQSEILRFTVAGNVDDGKSTLIGRLLYDSKAIYDDQIAAIKITSERKGKQQMDLSLLTDGLKEERALGITIDVAYRYFATGQRKFIISDTPGHVEFTRNMVTGASNANTALILIDARNGITSQTLRHSYIASLLQLPNLIVCINKMDLVNYSESVFEKIKNNFESYVSKFAFKSVDYIPISALIGDNIVHPSLDMDWYPGNTLINTLENIPITQSYRSKDARFPVQLIIQENEGYKGYAGKIASGFFKLGDQITALPLNNSTKIKQIQLDGKELNCAFAPMSVSMTFENEIPVVRGDLIVKTDNLPNITNYLDVVFCWLSETPLNLTKMYLVQHTTTSTMGTIEKVHYQLDIATLEHNYEDKHIDFNSIFKARMIVSQALIVDNYNQNKITGSLILIDIDSNETIAAGMIEM